MKQQQANNARSEEPERREGKNGRLRDTLIATLPGFILTGVVGTVLAAWFQERGWAWQEAIQQVEKDTASVMDSLQSASDLLNRRWSAAIQMVQVLETPALTDASKAKDNFLSVDHDWQLAYADVDVKVQFNVDRPFGIDASLPESLWNLPCTTYPFGSEGEGTVDPRSVHVILNVINRCHGVVSDAIKNSGKTSLDQTARKQLIEETSLRLSHIYYLNDALRCVILERAAAMRRSLNARLGWGSFFWIGRQTYYVPAKEGDCFSTYRGWYEERAGKKH